MIRIGLTIILDDSRSVEDLIMVVDEALYEAKNKGRNRIEIR